MRDDLTLPADSVRIPLRARDGSVRAYALVDAADAEWANQWTWGLIPDGYAYRRNREQGQRRAIFLHRELLGLTHGDGLEVDHINRDRLDNRRANLRAVPRTGRPNSQNRQPNSKSASPHRGVVWHKSSGRWHARVHIGGKRVHLGAFASDYEAAVAAKAARLRLMPYAVD